MEGRTESQAPPRARETPKGSTVFHPPPHLQVYQMRRWSSYKGFVHIRRLDIKKFFDSFSHAAMLSPALPIAHKVAEHVVIGRHYNVKVDDKLKHGPNGSTVTDYLDLVGHAGIPQGSAVSPLIGEFFTSQLGVKMPKGARFINFVDDYLVLAKSPAALIKAENALKSAVANLPVGDFELLEKSGSSPYSPDLPSSVSFEFLGHAFFLSKGKVVVHVNDANVNKADIEIGYRSAVLASNFKKWGSHPAAQQEAFDGVVDIAHYIRCWRRTFSAADNAEELGGTFDAYVLHLCDEYPFLSMDKVIAKANSMPAFDLDPY